MSSSQSHSHSQGNENSYRKVPKKDRNLRIAVGSLDLGTGLTNSNRKAQHKNNLDYIPVDLKGLRDLVKSSIEKNHFDNAIFFANKLVTLGQGFNQEGSIDNLQGDVYLLARAYYLGKEFRRAVHVLDRYGLLLASSKHTNDNENVGDSTNAMTIPSSTKSVRMRENHHAPIFTPEENNENLEYVLLATQCLMECGEEEEAQQLVETVLGDATIDELQIRALKVRDIEDKRTDSPEGSSLSSVALLCLLRAKIYERSDNRPRAVRWFKAALFCDIRCYEAFDALVDNQLEPSQERQLIEELRAKGAFDKPENKWIDVVYTSKLSKHDFSAPMESRFGDLKKVVAKGSEGMGNSLEKDLECVASQAECQYNQHDAQGAYQLTQWIRQRDPYQLRCLVVHLACLVELKRKSELFYCAHRLVDAYPTRAIAWFAVGCYYYAISKYDVARRYFHKATSIDPSLAPAWLGFGHSFAMQDESDQAMAAYRTASRLFTGCHLPVLCTAIEYLRTNNITLAEQFCRQAKSMCATDPLVLNELGVVHYKQRRYQQAAECFREALNLCNNQPERLRSAWEPAMFNLGHAYRKLGRYKDAIHQYQAALSYAPKEASTYAALGLTFHLQGMLENAIQHYHNALGLKPEDTFSHEMIDKALTESYATGNIALDNGLDNVMGEFDSTCTSKHNTLGFSTPVSVRPSATHKNATPPFSVHIPGQGQTS